MGSFGKLNNFIIDDLLHRFRYSPNCGYKFIIISAIKSQKWIHVFCLFDAKVQGEFEIHSEIRGYRLFRILNEPFACYFILIVPN